MFGKDRAKKAEEEAARQRAQANQRLDTAAQATPLQSTYEKMQSDFLNWMNSPDKDVRNAPGMAPHLDLYNRAIEDREDDWKPMGLYALGDPAAVNPMWAANMTAMMRDRRRDRAAGALENAFNRRYAEAAGAVLPLSSLNNQRNLSVAEMSANQASGAQQRADALRARSGIVNNPLFGAAVQAGLGVATGGLSSLGSLGSLGRGRAPAAPAGGSMGYGSGSRFGWFRDGGTLERPGDAGWTGEGGEPELVNIGPDGRTHITPQSQLPAPVLRSLPPSSLGSLGSLGRAFDRRKAKPVGLASLADPDRFLTHQFGRPQDDGFFGRAFREMQRQQRPGIGPGIY